MSAPFQVRLRSEVEKPEDIDLLYWVGCCVSADDRVSAIARAVARILTAAGVRFAVLGGEEQCCGDPARRTGNEFHFETLARANIETFRRYGVTRILAHCPHCLHVLRNEYPRFGADFEVVHHTELIRELIDSGRLKLVRRHAGITTFHDPCYLARYNRVTAAPRRVLDAASEKRVEMHRMGERTFCCGGGGGHSFFEDTPAGAGGIGPAGNGNGARPAGRPERINAIRTREALATGSDTICTACPYCLSMMEDGVRVEGAERVRVRDIAEVVAELI